MSVILFVHSSGATWRSDNAGGFNGFGNGATGQMWRSDNAGGFKGFGGAT